MYENQAFSYYKQCQVGTTPTGQAVYLSRILIPNSSFPVAYGDGKRVYFEWTSGDINAVTLSATSFADAGIVRIIGDRFYPTNYEGYYSFDYPVRGSSAYYPYLMNFNALPQVSYEPTKNELFTPLGATIQVYWTTVTDYITQLDFAGIANGFTGQTSDYQKRVVDAVLGEFFTLFSQPCDCLGSNWLEWDSFHVTLLLKAVAYQIIFMYQTGKIGTGNSSGIDNFLAEATSIRVGILQAYRSSNTTITREYSVMTTAILADMCMHYAGLGNISQRRTIDL